MSATVPATSPARAAPVFRQRGAFRFDPFPVVGGRRVSETEFVDMHDLDEFFTWAVRDRD